MPRLQGLIFDVEGTLVNSAVDLYQIFPGTIEILASLTQAGIRLGVCTNRYEKGTKTLLEKIGLRKYFGFVAGSDTFRFHKPHPDHVSGVLKALNIPGNACVMVGDGTNDVLAAHGAGISCIVVSHAQPQNTDYKRMGADLVIENFTQLPEALRELGFTY